MIKIFDKSVLYFSNSYVTKSRSALVAEIESLSRQNIELVHQRSLLEANLAEQERQSGLPWQRLFRRYKAYSGVPNRLRSHHIAFLHIGKTGGTTIHYLIREAVGLETSVFHGSPELFDQTPADELADYGLLLGHFSFGHVHKMRRPLSLITFLRDPVERVLSSYYYLREATPVSDNTSATMLAKQMSLSDFLDCDLPNVTMFTVDHQCHALTTDWRGPREANRKKLVGDALTNLAQFAVVGFAERFDESVARLSNLLEFTLTNCRLDLHMNRTNTREKRENIDPEIISKIERLNAGNMELYSRSLRVF